MWVKLSSMPQSVDWIFVIYFLIFTYHNNRLWVRKDCMHEQAPSVSPVENLLLFSRCVSSGLKCTLKDWLKKPINNSTLTPRFRPKLAALRQCGLWTKNTLCYEWRNSHRIERQWCHSVKELQVGVWPGNCPPRLHLASFANNRVVYVPWKQEVVVSFTDKTRGETKK